jgi:citrate lyase subunit beta/citryl-CoA lyase
VASRIVEAYAHATGVQARGAVMFGDEMIDEASHKMARAIVARGRAAGLGHDDPPGRHRHDDPRP